MKIIKRFKIWWRGKLIPPTPEELDKAIWDPDYKFIDKHEHPPLAKLLIAIGLFWLRHWQWVIGAIIAIIALFIKAQKK